MNASILMTAVAIAAIASIMVPAWAAGSDHTCYDVFLPNETPLHGCLYNECLAGAEASTNYWLEFVQCMDAYTVSNL